MRIFQQRLEDATLGGFLLRVGRPLRAYVFMCAKSPFGELRTGKTGKKYGFSIV